MRLKKVLAASLCALACQASAQAQFAAQRGDRAEAQKPSREKVTRELVIPGGRAVWSQGVGPARAEDQTAQERSVVAMEAAEQLLVAVEFYQLAMKRWPDNLKQATDRARLGVSPIVIGLGPWELGPSGSIQARVEDPELCEALRLEGSLRSAAGMGSQAGCQPDPTGSGAFMMIMAQMVFETP